jgi:mannose-1-phosphate guanylyltransferase
MLASGADSRKEWMSMDTAEHLRARHEQHKRHLWAIVLAGGEGVRLRPLVRHVCGDERPKQYVPLLDSRTLLRQTVDRVARLFPSKRIVVVTLEDQAGYVARELETGPSFRILVQPEARGTAAGVLFPAHWIHAQDPDATVVVFPSDHYIREEAAFMHHVAGVAAFIVRHPERIVLVGARPTDPEPEYGWIEPGERLGWMATAPVYRIRRFREKPSREVAQGLFTAGSLWNTLVFGARVSTLIEAGRECVRPLHDRLARLSVFLGTEHERWATRHAYALAPTANFSRTILEACPEFLAVSKLPELTWSDLGTPERVVRTMTTFGISPPWLDRVAIDRLPKPVGVTT